MTKTIIENKVRYGMSSGRAFIFTKSNGNIKVRRWRIHKQRKWFSRRWLMWFLTTIIYLQRAKRDLLYNHLFVIKYGRIYNKWRKRDILGRTLDNAKVGLRLKKVTSIDTKYRRVRG